MDLRDRFKVKYPRLTNPELDRLTLIVEEVNSYELAGGPKSLDDFARLRTLTAHLVGVLGRKRAHKLCREMDIIFAAKRGSA